MSDEPTGESALTFSGVELLERAPRVQSLLARARESQVDLRGVYVVGGAVRDAILGIDPGADIDLAVEGDGRAFGRELASALAGEVESEHDFGTSTSFIPLRDGDDASVVRVDVASCRLESYDEPGALPSVQLGASIEHDLHRRDVTVNSIAVALEPDDDGVHRIVDPEGGRHDLDARLLRVLHDGSFLDDPTRIFRVARYAGRLGFRVDEHTRALAMEGVVGGALGTVSAERVRTELRLALQEPAWDTLTLLSSWGVLERLEPRLEAAFRPPLLLRAIDEACGDDPDRNDRAWTLRLAALARPLGDDAAGWMSWLGFPADVVNGVADHVRVLDAVLGRADELRALPNSGLYLELGDVADDTLALVALAVADTDPELVERLVAFATAAEHARLTVRGTDVIEAGVSAGPMVGRILGDLFLRTLDGELAGEADERRALAELVEQARRIADEGTD